LYNIPPFSVGNQESQIIGKIVNFKMSERWAPPPRAGRQGRATGAAGVEGSALGGGRCLTAEFNGMVKKMEN